MLDDRVVVPHPREVVERGRGVALVDVTREVAPDVLVPGVEERRVRLECRQGLVDRSRLEQAVGIEHEVLALAPVGHLDDELALGDTVHAHHPGRERSVLDGEKLEARSRVLPLEGNERRVDELVDVSRHVAGHVEVQRCRVRGREDPRHLEQPVPIALEIALVSLGVAGPDARPASLHPALDDRGRAFVGVDDDRLEIGRERGPGRRRLVEDLHETTGRPVSQRIGWSRARPARGRPAPRRGGRYRAKAAGVDHPAQLGGCVAGVRRSGGQRRARQGLWTKRTDRGPRFQYVARGRLTRFRRRPPRRLRGRPPRFRPRPLRGLPGCLRRAPCGAASVVDRYHLQPPALRPVPRREASASTASAGSWSGTRPDQGCSGDFEPSGAMWR
jgi:hypothetical protein